MERDLWLSDLPEQPVHLRTWFELLIGLLSGVVEWGFFGHRNTSSREIPGLPLGSNNLSETMKPPCMFRSIDSTAAGRS